MTINRWILSCQGRVANIWYNQNYTVYGLNPAPGPQGAGDSNIIYLQDLGGGNVALQCGAGYNAYASMRDDYYYQVQFQAPNGTWVNQASGDETFRAVPAGDGYFALLQPYFGRYVTINPSPNPIAGECNALVGGSGNLSQAARFSATGLDGNVIFDLLRLVNSASGMSFAGINLGGRTLTGDLSLCDFRHAASLSSCVMNGANLKQARFAGQHLAGLQISGTDCTGADFSGCDFTGFVPGTPPPVLNQANLTGTVLPAGVAWSNPKMAGAVLAEANLTGCDLSSTGTGTTDLAGANFTGAGVTVFSAGYPSGTGIGGYDLANAADRVIGYDAEGTGRLDYLVCYRPGKGAIGIIAKQGPQAFGHIYLQGDPGHGIGGCDLSNPADQIIAYDYEDTGHLNYLVCYRPGTGMIWIVQNQGGGTFGTVFTSANGIGGYDLGSSLDRVIAFDYEGKGHPSYLVCYRPGKGAIGIMQKQGPQAFGHVYMQGDPGQGIDGCDLASPADQIIAYDYAGTGKPDHLVCYRPGTGIIRILGKKADSTYAPVYESLGPFQPGGIGGYDLASPADQIIAYDYAGTGKADHLVCYRPGARTIWIIGQQPLGPATLAQCKLTKTNLSGVSLAGFDLTTVTLTGANLTGTSLAGTTLGDADLTGTILAGTDFTGLDLSRVHFTAGLPTRSTDPDKRTVFAGCTLPFAAIGLNWSYLDLTGATMTGLPVNSAGKVDLTGLNAVNMQWLLADFTGCILDGADFASAVLTKAKFTHAMLRQGPQNPVSFRSATLIGAVFTRAVLDQADFGGATLGGVVQTEAAGFANAFLSNCNFNQANLYGVIFAATTMIGQNKLAGAANLQQTDFSGAYLPTADFTGASLQGAKFDHAFMVECVLTRADLTPAEQGAIPASLDTAFLQAARLDGVKLGGANLADAVITSQHGTIGYQYIDQDGNLTPPNTINYPPSTLPAAASFTDETTCPNEFSYKTNHDRGLTIAQMTTRPQGLPTQWTPPQQEDLTAAEGGSGQHASRGRPGRGRPGGRDSGAGPTGGR